MTDPAGHPTGHPAGIRPTHLPGLDFGSLPLTPVRLPRRTWVRMFPRAHDPIFFNRQPGNRFTPPDGPYPVLYLGADTRTCFLETFGDELYTAQSRLARSRWLAKGIVRLETPKINVCNLADDEILTRIGADKAALYSPDLSIPQRWAAAIMAHPVGFEGILYASRFGPGQCLALFDRARSGAPLKAMDRIDLQQSREGEELIEEFNIVLI